MHRKGFLICGVQRSTRTHERSEKQLKKKQLSKELVYRANL